MEKRWNYCGGEEKIIGIEVDRVKRSMKGRTEKGKMRDGEMERREEED